MHGGDLEDGLEEESQCNPQLLELNHSYTFFLTFKQSFREQKDGLQ